MPSRTVRHYPSDLTDAQWRLIRHLFPNAKPGGRPRTTNIRSVVNAIFYLNRTGCAWRYLPKSFPPWKTVHHYFSQWCVTHIWKLVHDLLVKRSRILDGKNPFPSYGIIDSQSVRAQYGEDRGYDGFKKVRGRKRHIMVDTLGNIHSLRVHAANLADSKQGHTLYDLCPKKKLYGIKMIFADLGYRGEFVEKTKTLLGFNPQMPKPKKNSGQGKPKTAAEKLKNRRLVKDKTKRWVVERTFAWFNHYRRLARDYEKNTSNSVAMIHLAMSQRLVKRIASLETLS